MKYRIFHHGGLLIAALLGTGSLSAVQPRQNDAVSPSALVAKAKLRHPPKDSNQAMTVSAIAAQSGAKANPAVTAMLARWQDAAKALGPRTIVMMDPRTGGSISVQPDGLPWIPGTGVNNHLTRADLATFMPQSAAPDDGRDPPDRNGINQAVLERIARNFMTLHPSWFPVPQDQLVSQLMDLDPNDDVRHVMFYQFVNGIQVEGAVLVFHIGHGNLVSFGGQYMAPVTLGLTPSVVPADVLSIIYGYVAMPDMSKVVVVTAPRLKLVVRDDTGGVLAGGYQHQLLYEHVFRVTGEMGTWRAEVDALSGELVSFTDINDYANIGGGVYPVSNDGNCPTGCEGAITDPDPMPFGYYNSTGTGCPGGGTLTTDTGGNYPDTFVGTTRFNACGPYAVAVNSGFCTNAFSETITSPASMNLGTGAFTATGTDCAVPVNGTTPHSTGDNHSIRTAFYNVNKYKEAIRGWRPTWTFNNSRVTINVNLNQVCNAYWNGLSLNMFKMGVSGTTTCRNTGEIAAVFDHELGHGLDSSEGPAARPGEAYADGGSILHHHDSCFGRGFFVGRTCGGYGDPCTTCTGVRGADFTGHTSGKPATIAGGQGLGGTYVCPAGGDICGFETHCAAYPIIESDWDAATIDLPHNTIPPQGGAACAGTSPGRPIPAAQAWTSMMRGFFLSSPTLGDQYACATNGTAGCGATTLFHLIKLQEDDNGNLTDGTPHAAELQCAYNRHQTGCTTDVNTDSGCALPISVPTVTLTPGANQVTVDWTATTNTSAYRVFRGEEGCAGGFAMVANPSAPTVTYLNTGLTNNRTYYYTVQAVGTPVQCDGAPSACASVVVGSCLAPTTVTAPTVADSSVCTASGINVTWTTPTWNGTVGTYIILRDGVAIVGGACAGSLPDTTLSCLDSTAPAGAHTYQVRATSGSCASPTTSAASGSVTDAAGAVPSGLANNTAADINACTATGNVVTWTAPTGWNDNSGGARTWTVIRSPTALASGPCFGALTEATLTCNDTSAVAGTAYTYTVRANNFCGLQTVTTPGAAATDAVGVAPSAVNAPAAADANVCTAASGINVTWTTPTWNGAAGTYIILRDGVAVVGGACAGSLPAATLACLDSTAAAGAHTYQVRATNGCALATTSVASGSATDLAGAVPSGLANNTAADINACNATGNVVTWTAPTGWNDNASGVRTWTVTRTPTALASGPCFGSLPVATLTCNDTTAVAGTAYTYTVRANNGCALTTTTAGGSATDAADATAPAWAVVNPQTTVKATPNINFAWPSAEASATYTTYSTQTPSNALSWVSQNSTLTLAWSNAADLATGISWFYTTTAKDACLNESAK